MESSRAGSRLVTPASGRGGDGLFVVGGLLLLWSAYIHFHLWGEPGGYRSIATIGPLFLLQSIAGLVIGLGVIVVRRLWAALVGFGFVLSTLVGFLLSVTHGLFGFEETGWTVRPAGLRHRGRRGGGAHRRRAPLPGGIVSPRTAGASPAGTAA